MNPAGDCPAPSPVCQNRWFDGTNHVTPRTHADEQGAVLRKQPVDGSGEWVTACLGHHFIEPGLKGDDEVRAVELAVAKYRRVTGGYAIRTRLRVRNCSSANTWSTAAANSDRAKVGLLWIVPPTAGLTVTTSRTGETTVSEPTVAKLRTR